MWVLWSEDLASVVLCAYQLKDVNLKHVMLHKQRIIEVVQDRSIHPLGCVAGM
jgi:hypothetical protein